MVLSELERVMLLIVKSPLRAGEVDVLDSDFVVVGGSLLSR
jgi:hypothetical protein